MTDKTAICENSFESLKSLFVRRKPDCNKGDFGTALVVGGSSRYVGAPQFSAESAANTIASLGEAAMLSGAGRSTLAVPDFLASALYPVVKFSAICGLKSNNGNLFFNKDEFQKLIGKNTAVALGMGAGDADMTPFVTYLLEQTECRFVLDADGLKTAKNIDDFDYRAVLTPHVGEFAALTGMPIEKIKNNPAELCRSYAKNKKAIVILKDSISFISDGDTVFENRTGNAKLAKGGSGDVLSGIVCGLLACDFTPFNAARAGAYMLGKCAELSSVNEYSNLPTDTLAQLPNAIDLFF